MKVDDQKYLRPETYETTRYPVDFADSINPDVFTSQDFYNLEQEKVFSKEWIPVGFIEQFQDLGNVLATKVGGQPIFIIRSEDGILRAFYNVCRHRGTQLFLEGGSQVKKTIRCPYHNWAFKTTGECVGTPLFEGSNIPKGQESIFKMYGSRAFDKKDFSLYPIRVAELGCLVFICLEQDTPPLDEYLGDLKERLTAYRLHEWKTEFMTDFEIKANYKLISENFMEYYHLPWVHPELSKISKVEDHHRWQGRGKYCGISTHPISSDSDVGSWKGLPAVSFLDSRQKNTGLHIAIYPNLCMSILPNHIFIIRNTPQNHEFTREHMRILVHPESKKMAPDFEKELKELVDFWVLINQEDIGIVERIQSGLYAKPYQGGRLCYKFEEPVHRYQNMLCDSMISKQRIPEGDVEEGLAVFT